MWKVVAVAVVVTAAAVVVGNMMAVEVEVVAEVVAEVAMEGREVAVAEAACKEVETGRGHE